MMAAVCTGTSKGGSIAWSFPATSGTARRNPARTPPSPNAFEKVRRMTMFGFSRASGRKSVPENWQ